MTELELRLRALGAGARLSGDARSFGSTSRAARVGAGAFLVVALALVALLAAGVLALSPGARSAFLELFHLRGATVTAWTSCRPPSGSADST